MSRKLICKGICIGTSHLRGSDAPARLLPEDTTYTLLRHAHGEPRWCALHWALISLNPVCPPAVQLNGAWLTKLLRLTGGQRSERSGMAEIGQP